MVQFRNPKWELLQPPAGPIVDAKDAVVSLAGMFGIGHSAVEEAVRSMSKKDGEAAFEDQVDFLDELANRLGKPITGAKQARKDALSLCNALRKQQERLLEIEIPVLLLNESLHVQLPTIFRRLNAGVPLKGYDLLAATWESRRLAPKGTKPSKAELSFLKKVLDVADKRIQESYSKIRDGYILDPNVDPLTVEDLSLFDLLYYLSDDMGNGHDCFLFSSDVLAFQVSALVFNGSISRVDNALLQSFPSATNGAPDLAAVPRLFAAAAQHVDNALKPLMAVSSSNLQLKGKVGLTPAVVYLATFLTHHTRVVEDQGKLELRSRGQASDDRIVAPGWFLGSQDRSTRLKETLPSWFVHDALTSVFAGSRAYEAVNERIWAEFSRGKAGAQQWTLKPSNLMFEYPHLDALAEAFQRLWRMELSVSKTPQRRRVSDGGAVLLRAAYSHLQVHDHVIDHVIPIGKGKSSALLAGGLYPLNHVANLMPVPADINNKRGDQAWHSYYQQLTPAELGVVQAALMVPWASTATKTLASPATFAVFLTERYKALVARALDNLGHGDWVAMSHPDKQQYLTRVTA